MTTVSHNGPRGNGRTSRARIRPSRRAGGHPGRSVEPVPRWLLRIARARQRAQLVADVRRIADAAEPIAAKLAGEAGS